MTMPAKRRSGRGPARRRHGLPRRRGPPPPPASERLRRRTPPSQASGGNSHRNSPARGRDGSEEEDHAADILDLTDRWPRLRSSSAAAAGCATPQFRKIEGYFRRELRRSGAEAGNAAGEPSGLFAPGRRATDCCRGRPAPPSIRRSIRWRRPCWCRTRARSRIWCVRCFAPC